jgi:P-type Mg2+ transporter
MPVLRTNGPHYQATGRALLLSSVAIAAITMTLPCSPLAGSLGVITVPAWMLAAFVALSVVGSACPPVATSGRRLPRTS